MTEEKTRVDEKERLERWRLILGKDSEESTGKLSGAFGKMDSVLQALYGSSGNFSKTGGGRGRGGLGGSAPSVKRWLGDIRTYFPKSVVRVMQKDALERLNLKAMLTEPEILETIEVDVNLVATLLTLSNVIPERTKETARAVVRKLVDQIMRRIEAKTINAVQGSLNRSTRTNRPKMNELDFRRTIQANLKNWDADRQKLFADRFIGYGRRRRSLRDVVLCVDESGSMANSVVYSSIFGAVLASIPSLSARLVLFDTEVVDLTDKLADPVDALFGAQLGGGTDIGRALSYCRSRISRPNQTVLVLITDLEEGGDERKLLRTAYEIKKSGVNFICLTALSDEGKPYFSASMARKFAAMEIPTFACTPDLFPDMMAAAIDRRDIAQWASRNEIKLAATLSDEAAESPLQSEDFL
ncbi:MAG: VWA domain-containing protein [Thermoguttaceae bacterium]|nr:VWA domain-containing protein [Thermoguttaceae bacterium]